MPETKKKGKHNTDRWSADPISHALTPPDCGREDFCIGKVSDYCRATLFNPDPDNLSCRRFPRGVIARKFAIGYDGVVGVMFSSSSSSSSV